MSIYYCETCDDILPEGVWEGPRSYLVDHDPEFAATGTILMHSVGRSYSPVEGMGVMDGEEYHPVNQED
jgi:hypothetical protein